MKFSIDLEEASTINETGLPGCSNVIEFLGDTPYGMGALIYQGLINGLNN